MALLTLRDSNRTPTYYYWSQMIEQGRMSGATSDTRDTSTRKCSGGIIGSARDTICCHWLSPSTSELAAAKQAMPLGVNLSHTLCPKCCTTWERKPYPPCTERIFHHLVPSLQHSCTIDFSNSRAFHTHRISTHSRCRIRQLCQPDRNRPF